MFRAGAEAQQTSDLEHAIRRQEMESMERVRQDCYRAAEEDVREWAVKREVSGVTRGGAERVACVGVGRRGWG